MITRFLQKAIVTVILIWAAGSVLAQPPPGPPTYGDLPKLLMEGKYLESLKVCRAQVAADRKDISAREALTDSLILACWRRQGPAVIEWATQWSKEEPEGALALVAIGLAKALSVTDFASGSYAPVPGVGLVGESEVNRALELDPKCADAHLGMALLHELRGEKAEARAAWLKFLDLEPNSERAWRVRRGVFIVAVKKTDAVGVVTSPTFSPDGKRIAAFSTTAMKQLLAFRLDRQREATVIAEVPAGKPYRHTDWSPDGKSVAFGRCDDAGKWQVFVAPAGGGGTGPPEQLTAGANNYWSPRWSPEGKYLLYYDKDHGTATVAAADGSNPRPLTFLGQRGWWANYAWGFDDTDILYAKARPGTANGRSICMAELDPKTGAASNERQLTDGLTFDGEPRVSPLGGLVAYFSVQDGDAGGDYYIWLVPTELGSKPHRLFPYSTRASAWAPAWRPDGRALLVVGWGISVAYIGGLDTRSVSLTTKPKTGSLLVSVTNGSAEPQQFDLTYHLFDPNSVLLGEGPVGKPKTILQPKEVIEFPLPLTAAKQPGTYTVKLTAVTEKGERVVELVDYVVK